jgi:cytidylate kinase
MMAAIAAAGRGAQVTLIEPNERLGKKLNITGKGRCNVTNNCTEEALLQNIPRNGKFLYSAFSTFNSQDVMAFFEELGVPLKTERGNRVFPQSDCSFDVSGALKHRLDRLKVHWSHDRAVSIETEEGAVTGVRGEKDTYPAKAVVLATGGVSYPATGSTGDGYRMAAQLGHEIVPPHGSLVPLVSEDEACRQMQGLALKNVELTVLNRKGKAIFREFGEMLFTHFGVSGPLVLSASAHLRNWEKETYRLSIDLKPALDEQKLESRILRDLGEAPNRSVERIFSGLVPHSMVPVILNRLGMDPQQQANAVTREQRRALVQLLKRFTMPVTGPRPVAEAIITSGGVKVGQVQPATMASKLVQGLYFAGEILDVDAYTGGFNLQIAWATGHCAGVSAAEEQGANRMDNKRYAVAIDGPSGAGKSTLAKAAAAELGILYVDTGAIYRTIGLYACRREADPHDLAAIIALLPDIQVSMAYGEDGLQRMLLNGEDVTDVIRRPEISRWASVVSAIPEVRAFLLEMQRELARSHSVVMDGRDIGTVVLPQAEVKIFLTASPEIRAQRRMKELEQRGTPQPYNQVLSDILQRDWADSHRETAPLRQAGDALLLDTSHLDFDQSREALLHMIKERIGW